MSIESQFQREEDILTEQYNAGEITQAEFNRQVNELWREYRDAAREAAQDAYERELENW